MTPRQKVNWAFAVALVLMAAIGGASVVSIGRLVKADRAVSRSQEFEAAADVAQELLALAESHLRGFLLTGDRHFLEQHRVEARRLPQQMARLKTLTTDSAALERIEARLEPLVTRRLETFESTIAAVTGTAAERARLTAHGGTLSDSIATAATELDRSERARMVVLLGRAEARAVTARTVIAASVLLALLTLAASLVVVNRDMAARARTAAALHEARERARVVLDTVVDGIVAIGERGTIETINPAAEHLFGWPATDLVGRNISVLMPEEYSAAHEGFIRRYLDTGEAHVVGRTREVLGRRRDGSTFTMELAVGEVRLTGRRLFTGVIRDVTERKRLEDALQNTLELQRAVLDSADNSIISTDPEGVIRTFNATAERWLGYSAGEIVGRMTPAVFHDRDEMERRAAELSKAFRAKVEPGFGVFVEEARRGLRSQREWTYVRRGGSRFPVLLSVAVLRNADGAVAGYLGVASDLTARKAAEEARLRSEARYRTVVEMLAEGILVQEASGRIADANPAAERILGYERSAFVGRSVAATPWTMVREDGTPMPAKERPATLALRKGRPVRNAVVGTVRPDGRVRWLLVNVEPLAFGPDGRATSVVASFADITQRRDAEAAAELARREAERANRAKSDFLANMSHELRTPLNSVIGFAGVLLQNLGRNLSEQDLDFLGRIQENGRHLLGLINSILDLSKIEAGRVELDIGDVSLHTLVEETLGLVGGVEEGDVRRVGAVEVRAEVPPGVRPIRADGAKLRQVLVNLIGNALKFTERGSVTVRVVADPATGDAVRIEVEDTGIGIPPERQAAVFEAFQQADSTTARKYGGTGLGLTISRSLIHLMGYRISLTSEEGRGSTFTIHIRLSDSPPAPTRESLAGGTPSPERSEFRGRTVLIIDDEADSRFLLRRMIEEHGARVVEAASGAEGLARARAERPDLVTVDLVMPEVTGWDVVRALRADPVLVDVPALVVSIAADDRSAAQLSVEDRLTKPVSRHDLLAALRRHLHARGAAEEP